MQYFCNYVKKLFLCAVLSLTVFGMASCGADRQDKPVVDDYRDLMQPVSAQINDISVNDVSVNDVSDNIVNSTEQDNEVKIVISAVGDVTLGNYRNQDYSYSFDQTYDEVRDESYFFKNVYDIFSEDDMTIVNLEGPLTESDEIRLEKEYVIKGRKEYSSILKSGSIEAVGLANNHILDYKEQGLMDTVDVMKEQDITYAYDGNVGIYEVKDVKIGYVAISQVSRGNSMEKILKNGIEKLKDENADIIIALCHWGIEGEYYPEEYQSYLGKQCIDWGADLVLGSHPHVIQGIEEYNGRFIVYSLGNFCFGGNRNPSDKDSMIFQQTFTFVDGERQNTKDVRIIPCSVSSVTNRNNYQPTPLTNEEGERVINRINEYSIDMGVQFDLDGYLNQVH